MKRFDFRLERVLALKQRVETERQGIFAAAERRVNDQEERLKDLRQSRQNTFSSERRELVGAVPLASLRNYSRFYAALSRSELIARETLDALARDRERKRLELQRAAQERKGLELLKERHRGRYQALADRAEQAEFDESAATIHTHNKSAQFKVTSLK